jgi:hypothetical protein
MSHKNSDQTLYYVYMQSILILSHTRLGLWLGLFVISYHNSIWVSHFWHACYMFCPSHPPWLYLPNTVWYKAHTVNLLIMQFTLPSHIAKEWLCILRIVCNTEVNCVWGKCSVTVCGQTANIALDTTVPTVPDTATQGLVLLLTFSDVDISCIVRLHSVGNEPQPGSVLSLLQFCNVCKCYATLLANHLAWSSFWNRISEQLCRLDWIQQTPNWN